MSRACVWFEHASVAQVRRMLGTFQRRLLDAQDARRGLSDVRDLVAATAVVHELEEGIARCREHLRAVSNQQRGEAQRRDRWLAANQRPSRAATNGRRPPAAPASRGAAIRRASAGSGASDPGVAGAVPPPVSGHGWPALAVGAGSAAAQPAAFGNAATPQQDDAAAPADRSFFGPSEEGISTQNAPGGDIHYAQSRR